MVTAAPGYVFDYWSGACSDSGESVVMMDQNRVLVAHFKHVMIYLPVIFSD
jgi:hypothetical protein